MSVRRYYLRRTLGPMLILAYIIVAILGKPDSKAELFPFFNWSLFSTSSNPRADIVVIVRSIDGKALPEEKYFYGLTDVFETARKRDTRFAKALDRLALAKVNSTSVEHDLRKAIESNFMREVNYMEYDLAQIKFDPIDRLATGKVISTKIIATYEKGRYGNH